MDMDVAMNTKMDIGDAFRLVRTIENLPQAKLAAWLKINPVSLSNIERKKHEISTETIIRFYFVLQAILESKNNNTDVSEIQTYVLNEIKEKVVFPLVKDIIHPQLD